MDSLALYHRLPYSLRCVVATGKGASLRYWRYGLGFEKLVEQVHERDQFSAAEWQDWQAEQLARLLHRAARQVPYYREMWAKRRQAGDRASADYLENWPILRKETLRSTPKAFVVDDYPLNKLYRERTGGTTGTPLEIYLRRSTMQQWYAMYEARIRRWHDVSINDRWAILGGQMVAPFAQTTPPFWVRNFALNQLYLSTHHLASQNAKAYLEQLHRYKPTHMVVYPSSANVLAHHLLALGLTPPASLRVIFSNSEMLTQPQRETIEQAFGCPIVNTYGMGEFAAGGSEAKDGVFYLWPDVGLIETVGDESDEVLSEGEIGRFVVTGLLNQDMPLIRYEVGDRGVIGPASDNRMFALPTIDKIEGRLNDLIVTADGRKIFWLNPVFYNLPIQESQIVQHDLQTIEVKIVSSAQEDLESTIISRLQLRVGETVNVRVERVEKIERTQFGKLRAIISHVTQ